MGRADYYNNGRPPQVYPDRFEESAREVLNDNLEVLSATFQPETVTCSDMAQPGWRPTPYAYLPLCARGPEIDRIPPLKLDLDLMDITGYIIFAVETAAIVIDYSSEFAEPRPFDSLTVAQTIDERGAAEGKLILEIKATVQGLFP